MNNRLWTSGNPNQGEYKKVLCICSGGLLRSPTTAVILSQDPYNFNTRSVGVFEDFALTLLDDVLINWADEFVCMEQLHADRLRERFDVSGTPVIVLNIPDHYKYRDPELIELIHERYKAATTTEIIGVDVVTANT